jgi:hypothetical protein
VLAVARGYVAATPEVRQEVRSSNARRRKAVYEAVERLVSGG